MKAMRKPTRPKNLLPEPTFSKEDFLWRSVDLVSRIADIVPATSNITTRARNKAEKAGLVCLGEIAFKTEKELKKDYKFSPKAITVFQGVLEGRGLNFGTKLSWAQDHIFWQMRNALVTYAKSHFE